MLILLAKIKFYFQVIFFKKNMFSLVSFFKTFSPTRGKKAILMASLSQRGAVVVCRWRPVPSSLWDPNPRKVMVFAPHIPWERQQTVVRSSFRLSVPCVCVLGTLLVVVMDCPFFPFWNEMRTQNTVQSARHSQRSDATEMICRFISLKSSNAKLILRLFLET